MINEKYEPLLNDVYKKYYTAENSRCKHFSECSKGQTFCDGLFCNRAKIGKNYGNGKYPKVLVVGKEPVTENGKITQTASLDEANNPHYRRTLYTLATVLHTEPKTDTLNDLAEHQELLNHFCLTNYFKCSFTETEINNGVKKAKNNSNVSTNCAMRKECWNILMDEIAVLKPEIIVMQGKSYSGDFWSQIKQLYGESSLPEVNYKMEYEELTKHDNGPNGSPLYIVWAYHPTARANYAWNNRLVNLKYVLNKLKEILDAEKRKD